MILGDPENIEEGRRSSAPAKFIGSGWRRFWGGGPAFGQPIDGAGDVDSDTRRALSSRRPRWCTGKA